MEYNNLPFHLLPQVTTILAFLLLIYFLLSSKRNPNGKQTPPEPSGSWPLLGHLPLLGNLPHITLGQLAHQYGPIFMIKLGINKALVVSKAAMAKECLSTNDKVFSTRPYSMSARLLGYNSAMLGLSPYGPYWREMRKITTVELLSNQKVAMFTDIRGSEVRSAIKIIYENSKIKKNTSGFDLKNWFHDLTMNNMVRLVVGNSLREFYQGAEYDKCAQALKDLFELAGAFVPGDALPGLKWMDIGGYEKKMKKVFKEIDKVAQRWLDEHRKGRGFKEEWERKDFMDTMIDIFEGREENPYGFEVDTIIKANCMSTVLAGTDTTAVTLTWALSLLLNNKHVLQKTQAELDTIIGKERQVQESDLKNLVYLQAVLKETMRLYPAGPLSVPREARADCTVGGYHIPAGTELLVNLYKIHRDPDVWENPLEFYPERFLTTHKDFDVRGQNYELMPFGSGRRMCPGISFALQMMQFTLANLIQGFDFGYPINESVDMTERFGLTIVKATPLEVVLTPRLPENLYNSIFGG